MSETTVWRYYCRFRPPMLGAIPRQGLVRVACYDTRQNICGGAWGFAEYDRPLTAQEIDQYELSESQNNPLMYTE